MLNRGCAGEALRTILASLLGLLPAPRPYGFGEAEGDGEAEGVGEAEGDAVGEGDELGNGEAVRSDGSSVVSSVVCGGGSYGPLSTTDTVMPITAAARWRKVTTTAI